MPAMFKPTKNRAATIRADLKARGVKANVRFFNWSFRIVLPACTDDAIAAVRDYMVEADLRLAGGTHATNPDAYRRAWSCHAGRGQIFAYDIR